MKIMKKKFTKLILTGFIGISLMTACGRVPSSVSSDARYAVASNSVAAADANNEESSLTLNTDYSLSKSASANTADSAVDSDKEIEAEQENGQKLVITMNYSLETKDLDALDAKIQEGVKKAGGYIETSSKDNPSSASYSDDSWNVRYASYLIRIPSDNLYNFTSDLEDDTNVINQSTTVDDITLQYIDTDSKRKALRLEQTKLEEMLEKAETVDEMLQVENALTDVRSELESIETQIRHYDNQVDYSTVNIDVTETKEYTSEQKTKTVAQRIQEGFTKSVGSLRTHMEDLVVSIVSNLPMILYYIAIFLIAILIIRFVVAIIITFFASKEWKAKRKVAKQARKDRKQQEKEEKRKNKMQKRLDRKIEKTQHEQAANSVTMNVSDTDNTEQNKKTQEKTQEGS